jgi:hypothetical protein
MSLLRTDDAIKYIAAKGQAITVAHITEATNLGFLEPFIQKGSRWKRYDTKQLDDWARMGCPSFRPLVWPKEADKEFEAYVALQEKRLPYDRYELTRFCISQRSLAKVAREEANRLHRENIQLRLEIQRMRAQEAA